MQHLIVTDADTSNVSAMIDSYIEDVDTTTDLHFGEHVMIDGYGGNFGLLDRKDLVSTALHELPQLLGMKCLATPNVYRAAGNNIKDPGGWTGVVVIEESHISIHTFPAIHFVSIDVYTCRNGLNTQYVSDYFVRLFDLQTVELNFLKRGLRFSELALGHSGSSRSAPEEASDAAL